MGNCAGMSIMVFMFFPAGFLPFRKHVIDNVAQIDLCFSMISLAHPFL